MTITKTDKGNNEIKIALEGRLDTTTAPDLEAEITDLTDVSALELDFTNLSYISSAGLRVLLAAQKKMNTKGKGLMVIKNANDTIKEVFELTGFSNVLKVE